MTVAFLLAATLFTLSSLARVVDLSNATIDPSGTKIAFVISRVDLAHNGLDDTLALYDLRTKTLRELSGGRRTIGYLAWSPTAQNLAAVMDDPKLGSQQLFVIDPATSSQRKLTHVGSDVLQIAWSPDGRRIAFTRKDDLLKKTGAAAYEDAFRVDDNAYLDTQEARPYHLWLVDVAGGEHRLTSGAPSVMDAPLSWSADSRSILYERAPAVHALHPFATMYRVDVATGHSAKVTSHTRDEDQGLYSPDGSRVAYLYVRDGQPVNQSEAWAQNSNGSNNRDVSKILDRQVSTIAWMPDGKSLLLQIDDRTQQPLVIQKLNGDVERLQLGPVVAAVIGPQGSIARNGSIVFIGDQRQHPDELYIFRPGSKSPERLTTINDAIAKLRLGNVARIQWKSADGFEEDGVLTYPPGYIAGRRYPLVLRIHGGPYESSTIAFSTFYQLAASHGYLVFAPNYRGSTDLGNEYVRAIYNNPNTGPSEDIMEGIAAVERLGIVDESRIAVSGWSYGGQLTSWLEGHYHLWRAAVAGAAVNDLVVDYAIADDINADRLMFSLSSPYVGHGLETWRDQSPISYYGDIRTPTLILCNIYDVRVPIVESYEMYHALLDNHIPVEFYAYPTSGHLPQGPVREADAYRRWLGWFDRWLK